MSSQKRRRVTKQLRDKHKGERALALVIAVMLFIFVLNSYINFIRSDHRRVFEQANKNIAENATTIDPCTIKVVTCAQAEEKHQEGGKIEATGDIESIVRRVFSENPEAAVKIAMCESSLVPDKIGDGHLAFEHEGELVGRSIGVMMVRTGGNEGGKVWNRAKANGMSVADFEKKMQNPEENIKYAHDIFLRSGKSFHPWYNCAKKNGLL